MSRVISGDIIGDGFRASVKFTAADEEALNRALNRLPQGAMADVRNLVNVLAAKGITRDSFNLLGGKLDIVITTLSPTEVDAVATDIAASQAERVAAKSDSNGTTKGPSKSTADNPDSTGDAEREAILARLSNKTSNFKKLFGLGIAVLATTIILTITLSTLLCTDGVVCNVSNIKIIDSNTVNIEFTPVPDTPACTEFFNLGIADSIEIKDPLTFMSSGSSPSTLFPKGTFWTVVDLPNPNTITIHVSSTTGYTNTCISGVCGSFIAHTTYEDQLASNLASIVAIPINAAAQVIPKVENMFCSSIPFLCGLPNALMWGIIAIIVMSILSSSAGLAYYVSTKK